MEKPQQTQSRLVGLIARRTKFFRKLRKLKQVEVAHLIGVTHRHLQKIEAGSVDVKSSTIESLGQALQVPACYLARSKDYPALENLGIGCSVEILDLLPVGVQVSTKDGQVVYSNRAHRELIGLHPGQTASPLYIWDLLADPQEVPRLKDNLKYLVEHQPEPTPYQTRNRGADGNPIPLKVEWSYIRDPQGGIRGFLSLITRS